VNGLTVRFLKAESGIRIAGALIILAFALATCGVALLSVFSTRGAQEVAKENELSDLSIDDGVAECTLGPPRYFKGKPGFGWVNKLTPSSYPATLRSVTIGFEPPLVGNAVKSDSLYRIVVYLDPEGDGPGDGQAPIAAFVGRVRGKDQVTTFNLITPLTVTKGSFVVGAIDEFAIADKPALFNTPGKSNPPGSESFFTLDGGGRWQKVSTMPPSQTCSPGSFLIHATVELGTVDPLAILKQRAAMDAREAGSLDTH
jgi:hypothetical protein